jgi:23S rRNA A2030 N6-methylase RlmJ
MARSPTPARHSIAALLLRDIDQMTVAELHPQEYRALTDAMLPYAGPVPSD